jgi:hypothetical protein
MPRSRFAKIFGFSFLSLALASAAYSQKTPDLNSSKIIDANRLAKEVVEKELNAQTEDRSLWKYHEIEKKDGKRKEVFEVVETKSGEIQRLVAVDDRPLNREEQAAEKKRIHALLADRSQWQKIQKNRNDDADQERKLFTMLPAAFRFEYDGKQGDLLRLRFTPNPNFHPTSREGAVFHHMNGFLWVDAKQKRLAEIDGRLASEVKFAHGLLGHLDEGGTFSVKQADVGGGHWEMTFLDVKMNGKALFFKTIAVRENETYSDFKQVPNSMSLDQAVELLLEQNTAS